MPLQISFRNLRNIHFLFCIPLLLLASCGGKKDTEEKPETEIRNVILLIGDGMGLAQVSSSFYFGAEQEPSFVRFPVVGLIRTSSAKQKITDSAAGATAFASGIKTYNGAIGVDVDTIPVETLCERLEPKGIASGLIATSSITHATPACFFAHTKLRRFEDSIALQLPGSGVDFFAGGGRNFFAHRLDSQNVILALESAGYIMDTTSLGTAAQLQADQKYGYLLAALGMPSKLLGRDDFLVDATELALSHLSKREKGFFLMVEGSQIDWESHYSNVAGTVAEMRDFDKAITAALDFAEKDGNTLVIVTADHETGGFALSPPLVKTQVTPDSSFIHWKYDTIAGAFYENSDTIPLSAAHTASMVPVFAFGPGAEEFGGIYQNTEIFHKMVKLAKW